MNSDGEIRYLADGESPRPGEIALTQAQAAHLVALSQDQRKEFWTEMQPGETARTNQRRIDRRLHGRSRFEAALAGN